MGKVGVYANVAHQQTLLRDFGNTFVLRDYRATGTPVSVLGEIALTAGYQVTNSLALHVGYRLIGVSNVALAPSQLDLNNSPAGFRFFDPHEFLLLHGVNLGAEIRW